MKNKCVFLDRDGVLNRERGGYTYLLEDFEILPGVVEGIKRLKDAGYIIVMVTNQSGLAKEIYTRDQMNACHQVLQNACGGMFDHMYYAPYHPVVTESLTRKPDSLMFEKAMAKFNIDPKLSWMVGDKDRDLIPAKKFDIRTILVSDEIESDHAGFHKHTFTEVTELILSI
jgi:D-glycero-D-manno-heptose 1,7-bisphosphate phosphatase